VALNKKVEAAMNAQLQKELQSAYVYLGMSAWCETQSLPGMASWLRQQFEEEQVHAFKFFDFIIDRGGRVDLQDLTGVSVAYKSPQDVFENALQHEKAVTAAINDLYALVADEKDFASQAWLDWFAQEQVEEEKQVTQIVEDLKRAGDRGADLLFIDARLGARSTADG
jgi:ferritin